MKIAISYGIGYGNHRDSMTIDESELVGMNEEEKDEYINNLVYEQVVEHLDYGWTIVD